MQVGLSPNGTLLVRAPAAFLAGDARRCCAAAEIAGARTIVAHAIDDAAVKFYLHHGFVHSSLGERVLLLPIETARASLAG